MAGGVPVVYRSGGSNAVASYSYTDLAEGTGIVKLYAGGLQDANGIKYRLQKTAFNTSTTSPAVNQRHTQASTTSTSFSKLIDLDFDTTTFNLPQTVSGTLLANIPYASFNNGANTTSSYCNLNIIKVASDGTTETNLVTISSATMVSDTDSSRDVYFAFEANVPVTNIAKGEKLRINPEIWTKTTSGTVYVTLMYDPQDATLTMDSPATTVVAAGKTAMNFHVPFRIDL